jgi:hypothetical protein
MQSMKQQTHKYNIHMSVLLLVFLVLHYIIVIWILPILDSDILRDLGKFYKP